jgi:hypothetical protein
LGKVCHPFCVNTKTLSDFSAFITLRARTFPSSVCSADAGREKVKKDDVIRKLQTHPEVAGNQIEKGQGISAFKHVLDGLRCTIVVVRSAPLQIMRITNNGEFLPVNAYTVSWSPPMGMLDHHGPLLLTPRNDQLAKRRERQRNSDRHHHRSQQLNRASRRIRKASHRL